MKQTYISIARAVRRVLAATGGLRLLDAWARRSRTGLWVRSWFSIYDLADLLPFDVPWWTFASADEVEKFLTERPGARVFEWGSGASTAWLSRRAGSVHTVEHDEEWADVVRPVLGDNVTLQVVSPTPATGRDGEMLSEKDGFAGLDFSAYVHAIDDVPGEFDLVVVDGRARGECFTRAVERLAPGGVLVFDNVDRERYRAAIAQAPVGVSVTWTRGRTPALPYPTRTALVRHLA